MLTNFKPDLQYKVTLARKYRYHCWQKLQDQRLSRLASTGKKNVVVTQHVTNDVTLSGEQDSQKKIHNKVSSNVYHEGAYAIVIAQGRW